MEGGDSVMSSVDKRVVQMEFDNAQFEKGIQQSVESLSKFEQTLQLKEGAVGLKGVQSAIDGMNFSNVIGGAEESASGFERFKILAIDAVNNVKDTLSTFGKIGVASIAGMGAAITGLAASGGIQRALNIEQAKFQMEGLGMNITKTMEDVNYAVDGTRYGLDAAARAAGQLGASNVKMGADMKNALRGISGVAAMTNSEYEDIAHVFTAVAGQGKVMTIQLRQLELRGINAAAVLAKHMHKTEAEVRDMVTKGKVDFKTFSKAMNNAFGDQATKANQTFTGAMANVKAALSRVGAEVATPAIENMRRVFVSLIPVVNTFKKTLVGFGDTQTDVFKKTKKNGKEYDKIQKALKKTDKYIDDSGNVYRKQGDKIMKTSEKLMTEVVDKPSKKIKKAIKENGKYTDEYGAVYEKVGGKIQKSYHKFSFFNELHKDMDEARKNFTKTMDSLSEGGIESTLGKIYQGFSHFATGFLNIGRAIGSYISPIIEALGEVIGIGDNADGLVDAGNKFREFTETLKMSEEQAQTVKDFFVGLFSAIKTGVGIVVSVGKAIFSVFSPIFDLVGKIGGYIAGGIGSIFSGLGGAMSSAKSFGDVIESVGKIIGDFLQSIVDGIPSFETLKSGLDGAKDSLDGFGGSAKDIAQSAFGSVIEIVKGFGEGILDAFGGLGETLKGFLEPVIPVLDDLKTSLWDFIRNMSFGDVLGVLNTYFAGMGAKGIFDFIKKIKEITGGGAIVALKDNISKTLNQVGDSLKMWQTALKASVLIQLAAAVGLLAVSLRAMSNLTWEQLAVGLTGISVLLGEMVGVLALLNKITVGKGSGLTKSMGAMIGMAVSISILAGALKKLSTISWEGIGKGLLAVTVLMGEMLGAMYALGKMKAKMLLGAVSVMIMSQALLIMSGVMAILSSLSWEGIGKGLLAITVIMIELVAAMKLAQSAVLGAASMLIMAAALVVITAAIAGLAAIPAEGIVQALVAIAGVLVLLGVTAGILGPLTLAMVGLGVGLVACAAGILVMAGALAVLSTIPLEQMGMALLSLAGILLVFGVASAILGPLVIVMVGLGVAMLALGAGVSLLAGGLAAFSASAGLFVETLMNIVGGLAEFVTTLLVSIVQNVAGAIPQIISAGVSIITGLINGLAQGLPQILQAAFNLIISLITGLAVAIHNNQEALKQAIFDLIKSLAEAVVSLVGDILNIGVDIVGGILGGIFKAIGLGDFADAAGEMVNNIRDGLGGFFGDLFGWGEETTEQVADGAQAAADSGAGQDAGAQIADNVGQAAADNADMSGLETKINTQVSDMKFDTKLFSKSGDDMIDSLTKDMDSSKNKKKASDKSKNVAKSGADGAGKAKKDYNESGQNLTKGLTSGVTDPGLVKILNAKAEKIGRESAQSVKRGAKEKSPSRLTRDVGINLGMGLIVGMDAISKRVYKSSENFGERTALGMYAALSYVQSAMDGMDLNNEITIRPVVDMTEIDSAIGNMNGLFADVGGIHLQGLDSVGRFGQQIQNTTNNKNINVTLNYDQGAEPNDVVLGLARALANQAAMEG